MKTFFEAYIWSLRSKLYRMAYLWLKSRDEAEDAVQEALEKAWHQREVLQKMENPTGWMVKVVKNQSLQKLRERQKWVVIEAEDEIPEVPVAETEEVSPAVKLVFRFLRELPEKQQEVFQLREVEGLTYEEIAEYMDISMDQVKVNMFRARKKLQSFLTNQRK
ncbi:RNA polymerase sigma factor [Echinicola vietnamensis]|uniref:RNA polymerase sigma factor, sigma-70 family n=1 Tax=Echinicola vietnamensis (strain DSM 17526 / LMG 23754 / KMM 6221) TaxID=926556 RepID=L0FVH7_ECHVK|nr:RNA polymerase sigma factor [Echinicola vietnamensis]AGA77003.1 RNA polymerase sigma factor, sigma-70 family [Echinicola vietnamensis DSM 17526]